MVIVKMNIMYQLFSILNDQLLYCFLFVQYTMHMSMLLLQQ